MKKMLIIALMGVALAGCSQKAKVSGKVMYYSEKDGEYRSDLRGMVYVSKQLDIATDFDTTKMQFSELGQKLIMNVARSEAEVNYWQESKAESDSYTREPSERGLKNAENWAAKWRELFDNYANHALYEEDIPIINSTRQIYRIMSDKERKNSRVDVYGNYAVELSSGKYVLLFISAQIQGGIEAREIEVVDGEIYNINVNFGGNN